MRTPEEWQEVARAVTDPLPPLSEAQRLALTRIATREVERYAHPLREAA